MQFSISIPFRFGLQVETTYTSGAVATDAYRLSPALQALRSAAGIPALSSGVENVDCGVLHILDGLVLGSRNARGVLKLDVEKGLNDRH
jgi:hypothetical protein